MSKFKRYTREEKREFAKKKQKESKDTLNTIYAIATEYSVSPENIAEFLEYSNSVYQYSPRNQILIQRQLPGAQLVQSKTRWEEMGYHIRPEFINKGAVVIRPITRTMYMDEAGNWKPLKGSGKENYQKYKRGELTTKEEFHYWQTTVSAYDITMTDCPAEDYPQIFFWGEKRLSDSMMADVLTKFAEKKLECTVTVEPLVGVRGAYYPIENRISLSILNQDTQKASTLAHEIGHAIQYRATTNAAQKSSSLKEVEADCYSILLCNRLGLEIPEGRKSHLARHYKKYIDEMVESGKYDPAADTDGSNNPFFHVMNDVKRVYESFIDSLDSIVREQQGNQIYIQNIQDQVNAVRLSFGSDSPDLKEWEKQFYSQIDNLITSTQFRSWQNSNEQMMHMSDDELITYLRKEVSDLIRGDQIYFPYDNNSVAFILQLQDVPENEEALFTSYRESNAPIIESYDFIYTHNLGEQNLDLEDSRLNYAEQTFSDLNSEYMPSGFIGHSLSVSDVVILYSPQNNEMYPYYVDRYGFQQLPDNFITPEFRDKLLADFTVVNEMNAYNNLKNSGYDMTSLEPRGNYLLSTYHPRLLTKKDSISLDSIDIVHTAESRYRLGDIQYNVMISKDHEVYLGNPERMAQDLYNNSDGSLIHLGKNMETYNLYRSDIEFADTLPAYIAANPSKIEAIRNFASDELVDTLSSFTEITPLKFNGVPFKDAFEEISSNVKPIATFTYYYPDSTDVAIEREQPLSDEEMAKYNVVQHESQEITVRGWYLEEIARQLDEIQFSLDPNLYQETIGIQYFNRVYNQKKIIDDIENGKMTYKSIQDDILQDIEDYPNDAIRDAARNVLQLLETVDQKYGEQQEIEEKNNINLSIYNSFQRDEIKKGLEKGLDVSIYANPQYDADQMIEIRWGLEKRVDVEIYAKQEFNGDQMYEIREGLEKGLDVNSYANPQLDASQMEELRLQLEKATEADRFLDYVFDYDKRQDELRIGREKGLDTSVYNYLHFNSEQMLEIRKGLEKELDVSIYANPDFSSLQMEIIREGLEEGLNVSIYANPEFDTFQMHEIKMGLESGLNPSIYASAKFDDAQMGRIREGLEKGLDVIIYANPEFSHMQMHEILIGLERNLDAKKYANPKLSLEEMNSIRRNLEENNWENTLQNEQTNLEQIISAETIGKHKLIQNIAFMENKLNISSKERITEWFGDYALYEIKSDFTEMDLQKRYNELQNTIQEQEECLLEYITTDSVFSRKITNNPKVALDQFTQTDFPRTLAIRICSDNIDIPDEPLFAGSNQTIDLNMFIAELKQSIGTDKDTAFIDKHLDQLANLVQEQYSDLLSLNDYRHEERDFRFHDKLEDLIQNEQVPSEMQDIIRDHESLIIRRLTAFDKRNTYLTKSLTNNELYQNDDLYLSAIEKTLNADKVIDPVGCVKLEEGKLNYTFWYKSQSDNIHGLAIQKGKTISAPYVEILTSEDPGFESNEILSLKDAQRKFAYLDNAATASLEDGTYHKTKFVLHLADGSTIMERYDLGDGYGGLIQFIDKTYSEGADFNLQYNHISQKEYDQTIKYKNELVKDLWNAVDLQSAEQEMKKIEQYMTKIKKLNNEPIQNDEYMKKVEESQQIVEDRISRINGRNKWFREYGKAGELDFGNVPPIKKGKPIEKEKNPIKKSSQMKQNEPILPAQNIEVEQ